MIPLKATFALDHISRSFVHAVTVYRTIMLLAKNIGESTSSQVHFCIFLLLLFFLFEIAVVNFLFQIFLFRMCKSILFQSSYCTIEFVIDTVLRNNFLRQIEFSIFPPLNEIFFTLRLIFFQFFLLQVSPDTIAMEFFLAAVHRTILVRICLGAYATFILCLCVVFRFPECEFRIKTHSFNRVVSQGTKNMDYLSFNNFHWAIFSMADKASLGGRFLLGALLADKLPQFWIDKC